VLFTCVQPQAAGLSVRAYTVASLSRCCVTSAARALRRVPPACRQANSNKHKDIASALPWGITAIKTLRRRQRDLESHDPASKEAVTHTAGHIVRAPVYAHRSNCRKSARHIEPVDNAASGGNGERQVAVAGRHGRKRNARRGSRAVAAASASFGGAAAAQTRASFAKCSPKTCRSPGGRISGVMVKRAAFSMRVRLRAAGCGSTAPGMSLRSTYSRG